MQMLFGLTCTVTSNVPMRLAMPASTQKSLPRMTLYRYGMPKGRKVIMEPGSTTYSEVSAVCGTGIRAKGQVASELMRWKSTTREEW